MENSDVHNMYSLCADREEKSALSRNSSQEDYTVIDL